MPEFAFKAFLSHRYKSPSVNVHLYRLFSKRAEVQFGVDEGIEATNVTRLERLVRDADAFIGLYPFDDDYRVAGDGESLRKASRYFRLELDIAHRAGVPGLVFYDRRFVGHLECPRGISGQAFDIQEVSSEADQPSDEAFADAFDRFARRVGASMKAASLWRAVAVPRQGVGVLLPTEGRGAYSPTEVEAVLEGLRASGETAVTPFPWPPRMTSGFQSALSKLDWVVTDVGSAGFGSGLVGYLHGAGIPTLRLLKSSGKKADIQKRTGFQTLFGGVEVGYGKDIVYWSDLEQLDREMKARVKVIRTPAKRIASSDEALEYFAGAARRNQLIFLSYAGEDVDVAAEFRQHLKRRFQVVFDYRDGGESIRPGRPWLDEIYSKMARSAVGVALLSDNYINSGNCLHEARQLMAHRDDGDLIFLPVKIQDEGLKPPEWMKDTQYLRLAEHASVEAAVEALIDTLDG